METAGPRKETRGKKLDGHRSFDQFSPMCILRIATRLTLPNSPEYRSDSVGFTSSGPAIPEFAQAAINDIRRLVSPLFPIVLSDLRRFRDLKTRNPSMGSPLSGFE